MIAPAQDVVRRAQQWAAFWLQWPRASAMAWKQTQLTHLQLALAAETSQPDGQNHEERLHLQPREIDEATQFIDLGLDSITGVTWMRKINEHYGTSIEATKVYSYPTLQQIARVAGRATITNCPAMINSARKALQAQQHPFWRHASHIS